MSCDTNLRLRNGLFYRLLDLLAARSETKGLAGHILINGHKQPKNYKCMTGYVVQVSILTSPQ